MSAIDRSYAALRKEAENHRIDIGPLEPALHRFLDVARRYAELEQLTLGAVPLRFPAHLLLGELTDPDGALEQGTRLAERERDRLGLVTGGLEKLHRDLERQGVKIIEVPFPGDPGILGVFVFDDSFGPAILIDAGRPLIERQYALCHEYGHFLADNNPYHAWICRHGGAGDSVEELRAHAFAGAFLVPAGDLKEYLTAAAVGPGDAIDPGLVRQLRVYFQADDRAIIGSLLATGFLSREAIGPLLRELESWPAEADALPEEEFHLSMRYIGLAVLAKRRGLIDAAGLARFLDTDQASAARIERIIDVSTGEGHGQRSH